MHGISSASPSHVRIGNLCYDVILWTIDPDGTLNPWIIRDGVMTSWAQLPMHLAVTMGAGTAAQAEADGRKA